MGAKAKAPALGAGAFEKSLNRRAISCKHPSPWLRRTTAVFPFYYRNRVGYYALGFGVASIARQSNYYLTMVCEIPQLR